ncbi:hypothetical protein AA103196_1188 [Ameyamaea chiangmaiensis NBRC 103196]|uniref:Sulfurtransferase TusA family protein n=1 Tax=Ameyamaea chiangmaiensis TaxID=442969 RepID=A0A850PCS3_9PROT|nr:sulfurtransferase TusA family protein [Ameyamaea chiangmaiensis]MBS4075044.1 sulfurtransferase TusA family protein [Ameyamaea chiangmaiensis]NVN40086.1 sulfurtransferase TusA family protein [Ameyamaea chiangmaiensis]GBQ65666.1 hypothetical protein AA103196_1188 [Ameyamaea chiangmaiensis NBRC 103196]
MSHRLTTENCIPLLDISHETCPMTFVHTRIALDRLAPGGLLDVRLKGVEARRNVPASARELGHSIVAETEGGAGILTVRIKKKEG